MIVPSMTAKEIHAELFKDLKDLKDKVADCKQKFERVVLKSTRYPVIRSYACQTKRKNTLIVSFTARKRSERRKPLVGFYGIYNRDEGRYAASMTIGADERISIYPPHFFKRYRERILKDDLISNDEVISTYFKNSWGFISAVVNEQYESVYHSFENPDNDDKVSFIAATSEGYCFGENQGSISIIKTIVSEEMLFENQKPIFNALKDSFDEIRRVMYE